MTHMLFREDAYLRQAEAVVTGYTDQGHLIVDESVFYPTGGGQPGDSGWLDLAGGDRCEITTTLKGEGEDIILVPAEHSILPAVGATVMMRLDWERRFGHMRVHTALHLMSVAIPFGVTGGSISADKGRLDFDMAEPPEDKDAIARAINDLIATDARVHEEWITEEELDAQPDLVKTLTVKPPRGSGRIRLIRIGDEATPIDLQPCGGTHVARLGEIGRVRLGKTEKKGRMNRRIYLHLDG
ncbi:alanyl-tRNA editing protein [uncultured Roseobacter sp.]|uniref:alanyl-tRNA editing protein n=1 Tax=uncultured Roseobacter sp. TaxID=114847 RepID=UPI002620BCFA|nr:alanyl-tRNA editing protein [uncultured Roseobacter sp.]